MIDKDFRTFCISGDLKVKSLASYNEKIFGVSSCGTFLYEWEMQGFEPRTFRTFAPKVYKLSADYVNMAFCSFS